MKQMSFRPRLTTRMKSILVSGTLAIAVAGALWGLGVSTSHASAAEKLPTIPLRSISLASGLELLIDALDYPLVEMVYDTSYLPSATEVGGAALSTIANAATHLPLGDVIDYVVP
jgi:hypothetical protein